MSRPRLSPWTVRAALLAVWLTATALAIDVAAVVVPATGEGVYAAAQFLSWIALVVSVVMMAAARHRVELGWAAFLVAAALAMQVAAAWLAPTLAAAGTATPAWQPAPGLPVGRTGPAIPLEARGPLLAALATALCFGAMLLHAGRVLRPQESDAPLAARARGALRGLRLNPLTMLFGPVFQKEVRVTGRRRGTYVARAVFPLVLTAIVAMAYTSMTSGLEHYRGAERLQRLQELAPFLAMVIAWCQFGILSFLAPIMTAPAICDERRQLTLAALMTTPMTSSQIVFGKLASRMVLVVILALVSTPLLLAVRVYGGLEAEIIVATTAITLTSAVLGASLGLLFSVWHRRATTAAVLGLVSSGLIMAVVIVVMIIVWSRTSVQPRGWVFGLSAPVAMFGVNLALIEPGAVAGQETSFLREVWATNAAVNLTLSAFVCAAATLSLRSVLRAEAAGALAVHETPRKGRRRRAAAEAAEAERAASGAGEAAAGAATEPEEVTAARSRTVGDRPVLWREVRQASFGSRRRLAIVAVAAALGALFVYSRVPMRDESLHVIIGLLGLGIIALQACMAATSSVAGEFESRSWHILLTTPLTGRQILFGKFLGAMRAQWFVAACLAAHFALGWATGYVHPLALLHLGMIVAGVMVMLTGTGLLLSMLLRRSTAAGVANMSLAVGVWLVLPIAVEFFLEVMVTDSHYRSSIRETLQTGAAAVNPFFLAGTALFPAVGDAHFQSGMPTPYRLPLGPVSIATFTATVAAMSALAAMIGAASVLVATLLFRRLGGRSS